jgi:NADH:ubiquinone oxidoreductase subunit H
MITDFLTHYYKIVAEWWISQGIDIIWLVIIKNILIGAVLAGFISVIVMILIWLERKIGGHFQSRMVQ